MIKIVIAAHKPAIYPDCPAFVPVWTGAARAGKDGGGHCMLAAGRGGIRRLDATKGDYPRDDAGDNISHMNEKLSELSAVYWAWKNPDRLGNPDHIGLMHYRRWFMFIEHELESLRVDLPRLGLLRDLYSEEAIERTVLAGKVFAPRPESKFGPMGAYFRDEHQTNHLDLAIALLRDRFPEYGETADRCMAGSSVYFLNMFIMPRDLFNKYCGWLFNLIFALDARLDAASRYPRDLGYVAERLTSIFLTHAKETYDGFRELPVVSFRNPESEKYANSIGFGEPARLKLLWESLFRMTHRSLPPGNYRRWLSKAYYTAMYGLNDRNARNI